MSVAVALGFALLSSLGWAGLDATRKRLATTVSAVALVAILSLGQLPLYALWWSYVGGTIDDLAYLGPALVEIGLNVLANLLFVRALEVSPLSVSIPFLSFTPVFATGIAAATLGELPSSLQLTGIVAVVFGALILTGGRAMALGHGPFGFVHALAHERGALYMLVVAFAWACTIAIDKSALEHASLPVHAAVQNGGVGVLLLAYLIVRGRTGELAAAKDAPLPFLAAVVFASAGFALQLLAIKALLVGVVETVKRAIGLVSAMIVGRVWFGEPITPAKIAASLIMAIGTATLMLG